MSPGVYTFAHEMGHNMGSQHDRANAGASTGAYSYSYGYQDPNRAFRTIMAYNCASGCPRINYWSNPAVSYNGKPTGVADEADTSADNAHSLNNTSGFVSGFRTRQIPVAPSTLSATNTGQSQIDLSWTDNSLNENGFLVWRSEGSDYSLLATLSANTTQYADAGVACGKAYSYKVAATNSVGASEESGPLSASTLPCTHPMAPVSVWAYASSLHSVEVSWSDVPNETNYRVEHSIQGSNVWTQVGSLLPANTTHITDSGLVEKTTYMYRVTALNFAGESTSVTMAQAITDVHPVYLPLAINNP
jgi:hypothetical protein